MSHLLLIAGEIFFTLLKYVFSIVLVSKIHMVCLSMSIVEPKRSRVYMLYNNSYMVSCTIYDILNSNALAYWQLEISLTELSLDILLFVIGKLNLAGPFSVRSSMILANCCKVCLLFP